MHVTHHLEDLPKFKKPIVSIGTFDGVHHGHRKIISRIVEEAKSVDGESILLSFEPHPRLIVDPSARIKLLSTMKEKIEILSTLGLDHFVVAPFTKEFSELDPKVYVQDFLCKYFYPHTLIIGFDHHFGKGREGNLQLLESMSKDNNFRIEEIPKQLIEDTKVSSTKIRLAIEEGRISDANNYLGTPYRLHAKVVAGDQRGRTIGYPTANLQLDNLHKLVPASGVYAVKVEFEGNLYKGMMNIGFRPTFGPSVCTLEVHLFDINLNLYDKELKVFMMKRLRNEQKFSSIHELKEQLAIDEDNARRALD